MRHDPARGVCVGIQFQCVSRLEYAHGDVRRLALDDGYEHFGRAPEEPRPEDAGADHAQRAPVDGDSHLGAEPSGRHGRSHRIHVAGAKPRTPTPDGKERDVKVFHERVHLVEQLGVARKVDGVVTVDHETHAVGPRPEGGTGTLVVGGNDLDLGTRGFNALSHRHAYHAFEAQPLYQTYATLGHDDKSVPGETPERGRIEMVVVKVGDEYRIGILDPLRPDRGAVAHERADVGAEDGVGDDPPLAGLNYRPGVPDVDDARVASVQRITWLSALVPRGRCFRADEGVPGAVRRA